MAIIAFPALETADEYGLLAVGGDLEVESLLLAYSHGIFPWPIESDGPIPWFSPPQRSLLFLDEVRYPKSFEKFLRKTSFRCTIDKEFDAVIQHCAEARAGRTWISKAMLQAYKDFHRAGYAHSVECWDEEVLVGGLYVVSIGMMFAGESMFHLKPNASKLALHHLIEHVRKRGGTWIDCQQQTPLVENFGARLITRNDFIPLLLSATLSSRPLF